MSAAKFLYTAQFSQNFFSPSLEPCFHVKHINILALILIENGEELGISAPRFKFDLHLIARARGRVLCN
jgi:hypothetical protein